MLIKGETRDTDGLELVLGFSVVTVEDSISFLSSMAIILGAIFVVLEIRDNRKMIEAATEQAKAANIQADSSAQQTKQNVEIAEMDIIMRLYEFANSREVQTAWLTVLDSRLTSFDDFRRLPKEQQVSFYQIASLFESLGVLLDRQMINLKTVDDMFLPQTAWDRMKPFLEGLKASSGSDPFPFFKKLNEDMSKLQVAVPATARSA
jgi:hypothetical protein